MNTNSHMREKKEFPPPSFFLAVTLRILHPSGARPEEGRDTSRIGWLVSNTLLSGDDDKSHMEKGEEQCQIES